MRDRMNRLVAVSIATMATSWLLAEGVAHAADPTKAECLAASSASLQSAADHKLRLERSQLFVCASTTCPAVVRKECLSRIDEVSAQIPTIVFEVKDGGGNELSAVKVTMDGEVVAEHLDGSALPLDPGNHNVHRKRLRPMVKRQVKPFRQQVPHHQVEFLLGGISRNLGYYAEDLGLHPVRARDLIGANSVRFCHKARQPRI